MGEMCSVEESTSWCVRCARVTAAACSDGCTKRSVCVRGVWDSSGVVGCWQRVHRDRTAMVEGCGTGGGPCEALPEPC